MAGDRWGEILQASVKTRRVVFLACWKARGLESDMMYVSDRSLWLLFRDGPRGRGAMGKARGAIKRPRQELGTGWW